MLKLDAVYITTEDILKRNAGKLLVVLAGILDQRRILIKRGEQADKVSKFKHVEVSKLKHMEQE